MAKKTAQLINGKEIAETILFDLKTKIDLLAQRPGLAVIMVGSDPASALYVRNKKKAAEKIGINFHDYFCDNEKCQLGAKEVEILEMIDWLNQDKTVNGIIVQLPLPKKFNPEKIIGRINPAKDVDGLHPENRKKIMAMEPAVVPPLIGAIVAALESTKVNLANKKTVIITKTEILAQPLKISLEQIDLKPEIALVSDKNLKTKALAAEVLIVIVGQKEIITKDMVKSGAIVIDVGTNMVGEKQWLGDVQKSAAEIADWITPVPGGIGPLTVAMLMKNVYQIAIKNQ